MDTADMGKSSSYTKFETSLDAFAVIGYGKSF